MRLMRMLPRGTAHEPAPKAAAILVGREIQMYHTCRKNTMALRGSERNKESGSRQDGVGHHEAGSPVATTNAVCDTDP